MVCDICKKKIISIIGFYFFKAKKYVYIGYTVKKISTSGRGGQSALRFARLRMEKRHNYVRKVAEVATQLYITNDKPNIAGLILAGSADFKTELSQSDMFDPVSEVFFYHNTLFYIIFVVYMSVIAII